MCELFAMSSSRPSSLHYSFDEFSRNGAEHRSNRDGWGIAMARDRDVLLVKQPEPARDNVWVRFVAEHAFETTLAMAHVRHATLGEHTMENTHPFRRVLGRRAHVFAHNGTLENTGDGADDEDLVHHPIGETDSEMAFCILLSRLAPLYAASDPPPVDARYRVFEEFCADMRASGPCNFLYFDGEVLFAHGHRRAYEEDGRRTAPRPPGLQIKKCWTCGGQREIHAPGLDVRLADQQTVLIASVPLDDRGWEPLDEGTVVAIRDGHILNTSTSP